MPPSPDPAEELPAAETLAQIGEWELIRRLGAYARPGRLEDDAALLLPAPGCGLVVNTDVLVEGVHFSEATTRAADVGWRATAANLSDLAAMGCLGCLGITVGLTAPGSTAWSWVNGVYGGIQAALAAYGGELLGGDCSSGRERQLAITALGEMDPGRSIRRADGRPGDLLVTSGPHGLSRLGLALLQGELDAGEVDPAGTLPERALQAHRHPLPRFDVVTALHRSRPEGAAWRVGGTDSSDGLLPAAAAIARASGCAAALDAGRLPMPPELAGRPQALAWCLAGGEDFELVLALSPAWARALCALMPGCQVVGELQAVVDARPGAVVWLGSQAAIESGVGDYQHFR